ncbi:FAS1 domain-containing protein [Diplogelasinospora grovesii]|uniref:FAS1 domain-containing protein n=1 Tax=Diplogelasinospora grovesii TaxID=303347 RepID=A0AAN6NIP5_9PEZI|nr:FAS1 domain-containing protein [Diplogelasinospora grovesii]
MRSSSIAVALGLAQTAFCQQGTDLNTALSKYPETSTFQSLLQSNPQMITSTTPSNDKGGVTVLVPNNDAFTKFTNASGGTPITSQPTDKLINIFQYHVMAAPLTSANFTDPKGLMVPTLLTAEAYNNRTAGADLVNAYGSKAALGQVLYVSKDPISPLRLRVRQSATGVNLRGGEALNAGMDPVDGTWSGGRFQMVDTILTPPAPCSKTIGGQPRLSALDNAIDKTGIWPTIDHTNNITCLAPTDDAFKSAGNPDQKLNGTALTGAILFHALPFPLYTPYITSGMVVNSIAGLPITITVQNGDIYFNDAKVISPNVLTNNGLIHVLDKVMSPNGTAPSSTSTSSGTATSTPTTSASATGTAQNNAAKIGGDAAFGLLVTLAVGAMLF